MYILNKINLNSCGFIKPYKGNHMAKEQVALLSSSYISVIKEHKVNILGCIDRSLSIGLISSEQSKELKEKQGSIEGSDSVFLDDTASKLILKQLKKTAAENIDHETETNSQKILMNMLNDINLNKPEHKDL